MSNVLIGQNGSCKVAHHLMHVHQDVPGILMMEGYRLNVRIDFAPLLRPVGADFFRPVDKAAFERPRPLHVGGHEGERGVNVARIEGHVSGTEQFGFWCNLVWHKRKWFSADASNHSR